jgi:hypothetical protein
MFITKAPLSITTSIRAAMPCQPVQWPGFAIHLGIERAGLDGTPIVRLSPGGAHGLDLNRDTGYEIRLFYYRANHFCGGGSAPWQPKDGSKHLLVPVFLPA